MEAEVKEQEQLDLSKIDEICEKYKGKKGATIPVLQQVQEHYGYLSKEMIERIGENLNMSPHTLYGVLTFYAQFYTTPRGKYVIRVCRGTACHVKGSGRISEVVFEEFGIRNGETTPDIKFTLEEVSCIGACGMAPVIMINDKTYGNLTPEQARSIFKEYAQKQE
ncbi:NADH-quinone oxidoreductase subunit NuoE [Calditerrivibrio nitroreducens]|uniref:NADH dehydrogenase subunit E n=1 Tax=Calditerrivibrio nitroreducens (strain DSM 19672 / NBRC 101217 / Yu37-1) TaxID=768670 RepID=E4TJX8_CALNY|nr:NADH-quinone oxidoreductase subunit NuoE [Calditerrivibrio nitroreducens]ADR18229.1 NADH dehydrogenase subunit E [Calditerrivibrio nitroreducens DSM 19672]